MIEKIMKVCDKLMIIKQCLVVQKWTNMDMRTTCENDFFIQSYGGGKVMRDDLWCIMFNAIKITLFILEILFFSYNQM